VTVGKLRRSGEFFIGPGLIPVLFALPWVLRSSGSWLAVVIIGLNGIVHLLYHSYYAHYDGSELGPIALLLSLGWRHLRLWRPYSRPVGAALCRMLPAIAVAGVVVPVMALMIDGPVRPGSWYAPEFAEPDLKAVILKRFNELPGRQLVFVRYSGHHDTSNDWIVNAPDPEESKVVVARENGRRSDEDVIRRFPGRQCWMVDADRNPPELRPVEPQSFAENRSRNVP
jgi:hypothetical protein